jgi:hypothetical protein
MANKIQLKRSAVAAKVPTTTDLDLGEIGVNTYDGKVYIKKDSGTPSIVEVSGPGVAPGTSGNVLTSNGTSWTSSAPSSSSPTLSYNGPMILEDDFIYAAWNSTRASPQGMWGYVPLLGNGVTITPVTGTANHRGVISFSNGTSGSSSTTYAEYSPITTTGGIHSSEISRIVCIMRVTSISYQLSYFGICSEPTADKSASSYPGAYIKVQNGTATPYCGTTPASGSTTTVTANSWYVWEIVNLGTSWEFRKNGTTFATFTTALPNAAYPYFIQHGNYFASTATAEWDYFGVELKAPGQRYT